MKSQVLTLLLLTSSALLFQSTHQYRLQKRELTEYDLTSFIVNTCSAAKIERIIQNLCDQTLQSALMGNFPFLIYYCKMIGSGNRYCDNVNSHRNFDQSIGTKRLMSRRLVRSVNKDTQSYKKREKTAKDMDLKQNLILQMCMTNMEKSSMETIKFCNETLKEIQQGRYPEIKRLCELHPDFNYCQRLLSLSSLFSWASPQESSSLSSSLPSTTANIYLSSVPLALSKLPNVESVIDQRRMNKNINKSSLS